MTIDQINSRLDHKARAAIVRESLQDLSADHRHLLIMRLAGFDYKSIGQGIGCSGEWARQMQPKASEEMKRALARRGVHKLSDIL